MSNRLLKNSIRLMEGYAPPHTRTSTCQIKPAKSDRPTAADKNSPVINTPVLHSHILPEQDNIDGAYTLSISKAQALLQTDAAHGILLAAAFGYTGFTKLAEVKSQECATVCNEIGVALYNKACEAALKTPAAVGALYDDAVKRYSKGSFAVRRHARLADRNLRDSWRRVHSGVHQKASQVTRQVEKTHKAIGRFTREQKEYLDDVVLTRRNLTGLASAGTLSVLSVALYKNGLPIDDTDLFERSISSYFQGTEMWQDAKGNTLDAINTASLKPDFVADEVADMVVHDVSRHIGEGNENIGKKEDARDNKNVMASMNKSAQEHASQRQIRTENNLVTHIPLMNDFRVSSSYGLRHHPVTGQHNKMHEGIDIAAPANTPVTAPADGVVKFAGWQRGYGRVVIISHENGVNTLYAHLNRFHVSRGERVEKGQVLARVGATGRVTGAHLHFEIHENGRPVNPRHYVRDQKALIEASLKP